MSKHKRLKPVREYLYDKEEMIEQMFSSIPIIEIKNMVPMKLQGMPLHELKAECLVELLEMSDREILSILDGKKTRDPSSSESEAGGVVVISDDERRIKKEKRTDPAVVRREDSDGSSTERSISGKKKNKRKSKEFDDLKRIKKKKVDTKQPVPSTSKVVSTNKEIPKKKRSAKPPEQPKSPPGEVVVLDDDSSDANEGSKKTGEKSLLDLLELEMRARAIRSLLKKEEETQALKVLSEYKDEPDDLIPVEIAPPQVDLLSDSDEDLKKEEPNVQPSTHSGIQMEVEGDALSLKDSDVLDTLLGIDNKEPSEVVEVIDVDDGSVDVVEPHDKDEVACEKVGNTRSTVSTTQNPKKATSRAESVEEANSQTMKTCIEDSDVIVKVERECSDEPIHRYEAKATPIPAQPVSEILNQSSTAVSSTKISSLGIQTPELLACSTKEIGSKNGSNYQLPLLPEKEQVDVVQNCELSSVFLPDGLVEKNIAAVGKNESNSTNSETVITATDVSPDRNDLSTSPEQLAVTSSEVLETSTTSDIVIVLTDSYTSPSVCQVGDDKLVGTDSCGGEEACVTFGKVSELSALPVSTEPLVLPVKCSKPLLESASDDFHANFEEDVLDYDYDPSLPNAEKQGVHCVGTSTVNSQNSPLNPTNISGTLEDTHMQESDKFDGDETTKSQMTEMVNPSSLDQEHEKYLNTSKKVKKRGSVDDQVSLSCDRSVDEPSVEAELSSDVTYILGDRPSSVSNKVMLTPRTDEEAPLRIVGSDDPDRVQAEEIRNDSVFSHLVNDQEAGSSEKHTFLVDDALGSTTVKTPRSLVESREHSETTIVVTSHGRTDEETSHSNQDYRGKHSSLATNSLPLDSPTIVTERQEPPEPDEHILDRSGDTQSELTNILFEKERIHFLADDALESSDTVSPKLNMMSQEHKETDSIMDSQETDVEGGVYVGYHDEHSNWKESSLVSNHKSFEQPDGEARHFDSIISRLENEVSFLSDTKPDTSEDVFKGKRQADVLANYELESPAEVSSRLMMSRVKLSLESNETDLKTVNDRRQISCKDHSQPSDHVPLKTIAEQQDLLSISSLENDGHDSLEEGSQSELGTNDVLIDKDQVDSDALMLPEAGSPRSVMKSLECLETDSTVDSPPGPVDDPSPPNCPSPKPKSVFEEFSGSSVSAQDVDSCKEKASPSRSTQQGQHFLVSGALDSLCVNDSKFKEVNREQNEVPSDVLNKVNTMVDIQLEQKEGDDDDPVSPKMFLVNDERNVGCQAIDLLKCESVCTHQGRGNDKVDDEIILQEDEGTAVVVTDRESSLEKPLFVLEAVGSACSTSDQGHEVHSVSESDLQSCSDHGVTAFVGCNSLETQKKIQITDGKAVQTPQGGCSGKDLDFIVVSSEDENKSDEFADYEEDKEQSSDYSFKNNTCSKVISPAGDVVSPFSQCESLKLTFQEESQIHHGSYDDGRDVITLTDEHTSPETEQKVETVSHQEVRDSELQCISSLSLNGTQPSLLVEKGTVVLGTEKNNSEIYEMNKCVLGSMGDGELTTGGSGCEGTLNHGLSCASSAPFINTEAFSIEPSLSLINGDSLGVVNNDSAVIVIIDEDSHEICCEQNLLGTKCLEEKRHVDFNPLLALATKNRLSVETDAPRNINSNPEIVEIEEESDDSSSGTEETESTSEDSQQSDDKSCIHSISDDEHLDQSRLNQNEPSSSPDNTEIESESITKEEGEKFDEQPNSMLTITTQFVAKGNSSSKQLVTPVCTTVQQKVLDGVIDISDSESGDNLQADSLTKKAVACTDNYNQNDGVNLSALPQDVDSKAVDEMLCPSNLTVCHNNDVGGLLNVESKESGQPVKVSSLPELEEGEIVDTDSLVEKSEDEGSQNKCVAHPKITVAQRRSRNSIPSTSSESDDLVHSPCRSRTKRKRLKKKRRNPISEQAKPLGTKKCSEGRKYQETTNYSLPRSATVEFQLVPKITTNITKQSSDRMDDSETIIIEDDEEVVQAIAKEMPPEILELDDSDETKTNWTARWLESSHVKKVVTTSKILTNARKKLKMKLKVKEVPEVEVASSSVDVPQLIGSVEEYHRLVREGVITSSSKPVENKDLGGVVEAGNAEAKSNDDLPHNSSVDKRSDEDVGKANLGDEVPIKTTRNENSCDLIKPVDLPCEELARIGKEPEEKGFEKSGSADLITTSDILLPVASMDLSATDPGLTGDSSSVNLTGRVTVNDEVLLDERSDSIMKGFTIEGGGRKCRESISLETSADCDTMVQDPFPPPSVSVTTENSDNKSSVPVNNDRKSSVLVNTDPMSSSIKSFYEIMSPNQVIGSASSLQTLSDIPCLQQEAGVGTHEKTVLTELSKSPSAVCSTTSEPAESNVGNSDESSACRSVPLSRCNNLAEGEIGDNDIVPNNNAARPNPSVITSVTDNNLSYTSGQLSSQPLSRSLCDNCKSTSISSIIPEANVLPYQFKPLPVRQSVVPENSGFVPFPTQSRSSSPNIGCATPIFQCSNTPGCSSRMLSTVSTVSHSTLSSVIPPSYTIPDATPAPLLVSSASQNPSILGVQDARLPMNPIQEATAGIHQYGGPSTSLAHPQMSVNVNSTLHMYDPYYSWVYRQGLSGSLNSSYGYTTPDASKDAGTIYKQWGEYYRKLMEACQDSAARASANNMFVPVPSNPIDNNKGYSWVFERLNQASLVASNPETNIVSTNDEPAHTQDPGREWNYRYGLKGLLSEHFVAPGTAPPPTGSSSSLPRGSCRQLSSRGKRKKKKR